MTSRVRRPARSAGSIARALARPAAGAVAAGAAAAALALALPAGDAADPLRGTLIALPLAVAAFAGIAALVESRGGRRIAPAAAAAELAAAAVLALLAAGRGRLGIELPAEAVLAGFVLVLADRAVRQAVAMRPLLGRTLPLRPPAPFFLLPLAVYLALLPWQSGRRPPDGDEPYYLLIAHSLAYDLDADLTDDYAAEEYRRFLDRPLAPQPGDPVGPHGEQYSRHDMLLPLVLAPAYRLAGKPGALAVMAALAAALAWSTLRLARHYWPRRPGGALAAWGLLAFTPPLVVYSYQVWVEVPGALLAVVALDRVLATRGLDTADRRAQWIHWLGIAVPLLLMPLLKMRFMLVAVPLLALAWWHAGRPRKPLIFVGAALAAVGAGILIHNRLLYDNALKYHNIEELTAAPYSLAGVARGFAGAFYDAGFGLFGTSPLWLIVVPAVLLAIARRSRVLVDLAVLTLPYLTLALARLEWYGGWSPPFRYALVALPLLALVTVPLLAERHRGGARALLVALAALTLVLTLCWVAVPGWTYAFADGRTYLLDHLGRRLGADLARLFPSAVRPRPALWIWPLATAVLLPLVWRRPRRLRRPAAWGAAGLLLAAAGAALAAERLPVRTVELEDPWVIKTGGHLYPDRWVVARPSYFGGWVLRENERAVAPTAAGGDEVALRVHLQLVENHPGPVALEVRAGDRRLGSWQASRDRDWQWVELGPYRWPAGEPLVVATVGEPGKVPPNALLLDRVELDWR